MNAIIKNPMQKPLFEYPMRVRDYECDAQGIVNNSNYQHYFEVARHEFWVENGINFYQLHLQGIDAVIVAVKIRYKHSLQGSEDFVVTVDKVIKEGIRHIFHQRVIRKSDGKVCAIAEMDSACMIHGKVGKPEVFDKALEKYISDKIE